MQNDATRPTDAGIRVPAEAGKDGLTAVGGDAARAGERTVRLAVDGIDGASCPWILRGVLERLPGAVAAEMVCLGDTTIEVLLGYEEEVAGAERTTAATGEVGFPARPLR